MANEEGKSQEGKGFTIQDRRRFTPDSEAARTEVSEEADATVQADEQRSKTAAGAREAQEELLPEINFSTFVISLSTEALMHLGEIGNPISGKVEIDVPVAKQMIDILGMLKGKTRGNLNASEDRLIEDILFDLRMKYVEAVKKR